MEDAELVASLAALEQRLAAEYLVDGPQEFVCYFEDRNDWRLIWELGCDTLSAGRALPPHVATAVGMMMAVIAGTPSKVHRIADPEIDDGRLEKASNTYSALVRKQRVEYLTPAERARKSDAARLLGEQLPRGRPRARPKN